MKKLMMKLAVVIVLALTSGQAFASGAADSSSGVNEEGKAELRVICSTEFETEALGDINALLAKYPDIAPDVSIEAEYVPWTELDNKLLLANAGGNYYDVMLVNNSSIPVLAEAGVLADMSSRITRDNIELDSIYTPAMADGCKFKDGIYAFPFVTDTRVLAVNTDILKEAGISEMPKTKEDMLEIARKVTKDLDGDGIIDQYGYPMNIARTMPCIYIQGNWLVANGLHLYDLNPQGEYVNYMDSREGKDFFRWAAEMGKYMPNDMISYDNSMIEHAFAEGKFAMFTYGAWLLDKDSFNEAVQQYGTNYELILNPEGLAGSGSTSGGWFFGASPKSENLDAAWDFLKFMMDPRVNAVVCDALPPIPATYEYAPYNEPQYKIFKEQLQTSSLAVPAFVPEFNELVDLYGNNLIAAVLGEKDPETAAEDAAGAVNALLKETGYQK